MKSLLSIMFISNLFISSAFSAQRNVEDAVAQLGKLAFGSSVHALSGKTAEEMLKNYYEKEYGDEVELENKEIEDITFGDETGIGLTSLKSAMEMNSFAAAFLEDDLENNEDQADALRIKGKIYDLNHDWAIEIKRLNHAGVKFAYSGDGPGYCGVSFAVLMAIDVAAQKIYRIYLSEGRSC